MINNIKIKICGLKNEKNIIDIYHLNPNYIGFIFYQLSPRFVGNKFKIPKIHNVKNSIKKVGVFVNEDKNILINKIIKYDLDYIQLHGNESPNFCKYFYNKGYKIIKVFSIDKEFDFNKIINYENFCSFFLFDTKTYLYGGSGVKFNWDYLNKYKLKTPFFLSGGISMYDIYKIYKIDHPKCFGIDINSKFEIIPGIKNINTIKNFIKKLKK